MPRRRSSVFFALAALVLPLGADQTPYQKPPQAVLDVLHAAQPPMGTLNPTRTHLLLATAVRYPPIADLAQPMLRLAGLRVNPATNGPHRAVYYSAFTLKRIRDGAETKVALTADMKPGGPVWSPDGKHFAFTNTTAARGIELWVAETETGKIRKVPAVVVNAMLGGGGGPGGGGGGSSALEWLADGRTLLVHTVPANRPAPPKPPAVPAGPNVQESSGKAAPVRTYQDLLTSPYDEELFDYYATRQLVLADVVTGKLTPLGKPGIYSTRLAPGGKYLLVNRIHKPYSYLHPLNAFPRDIEVWDRTGRTVRQIASLPLEDRVPIEGVPVGPRAVEWRPLEPPALFWAEAMDGGNPKETVPHRDKVMMLAAPFTGEAREIAKTEHRFAGLDYGDKGLMLLSDYDRNKRWRRVFQLDPNDFSAAPKQIWSRSVQDRYRDPGTPLTRRMSNGHTAIQQDGSAVFLVSNGATPRGDRPFLDRFDLATGKSERLFRSGDDVYEAPAGILDEAGTRLLIRRESPAMTPNYFLRDASGTRAFTEFPDPTPQLRGIKKQLVTYKRADGVPLSFTLYLPPGYQPGRPLPTVVWAYPLEFNDADTAGQVSGSAQRFTSISGMSHLFFLLAGYAILDNASMPVVGDPETVNNTYIEQVVASAKAAIDKAAEMGVTDPNRVGVGGHSYGAFMTANLLAHSKLFRAGIGRSGAYNRTLTPFGFQSERRTFWEAPEVYMNMSPFRFAHQIKTPLLLIHGEADDNPGTFPIQSDRLYQAVRGNGGTVRLVTLPHEAHGYTARESIEHTLAEMIAWFDKYVKNAN